MGGNGSRKWTAFVMDEEFGYRRWRGVKGMKCFARRVRLDEGPLF